jgi:hypothetical protein
MTSEYPLYFKNPLWDNTIEDTARPFVTDNPSKYTNLLGFPLKAFIVNQGSVDDNNYYQDQHYVFGTLDKYLGTFFHKNLTTLAFPTLTKRKTYYLLRDSLGKSIFNNLDVNYLNGIDVWVSNYRFYVRAYYNKDYHFWAEGFHIESKNRKSPITIKNLTDIPQTVEFGDSGTLNLYSDPKLSNRLARITSVDRLATLTMTLQPQETVYSESLKRVRPAAVS